MKKIGFLISTMFGSYPSWINNNELRQYEILVVDQCHSVDLVQNRNITIIKTTDRGLSKSRNLGLAHCRSQYVLIVDNDNNLLLDQFKRLEEFILTNDHFDVIVNSSNLKNFHFSGSPRSIKYREIFGVASWQLCINRNLIGMHRFDERFGLGASDMKANHGEENIFLADVYSGGGSIVKTPFIVFTHDDLGTGAMIFAGFWRSKFNIYRRATNTTIAVVLLLQKFIRIKFNRWKKNIF